VLRHVAEAELIRLPLRLTPVLEHHQLHAGARELPERALELGNQHHAHAQPELRQLRAADLLHGVARGHVANLMSEHGGDGGLGVEVRQDPARHEDGSTRQREGIHRGVVDHLEGPREIGPLRSGGELLADAAHVVLQPLVRIQPDRLRDLLRGLLPHRDLLRFGHENELPISGDGIRRTRTNEQRCRGR
jgi:hypothetical protein